MSILGFAIRTFETAPLPDAVTRTVIDGLVTRTKRRLASTPGDTTRIFAADMTSYPIACYADSANGQHYEVPAAFFSLVLGPKRKYSCCLYENPDSSLADAEVAALSKTAERADLQDGQKILELGCGWGSMSLWMARTLPNAHITAVSNSNSQRAYIEAEAKKSGLTNLQVLTRNVEDFKTTERFDRVVSIEMFEHMSNWDALLQRVRTWLKPDGRLFIHVFSHRQHPYRFDHTDPADWIGQHFFTGGIMPSHRLIEKFPHSFSVDKDWTWSGTHYQRTANDWLVNFDSHTDEIMKLFEDIYGNNAQLWHRRWRLFFLSTAQLFGHDKGQEWAVSHYLLKPAQD
jgi:cyclopropane-fatty-acyl-phospholipid synthase